MKPFQTGCALVTKLWPTVPNRRVDDLSFQLTNYQSTKVGRLCLTLHLAAVFCACAVVALFCWRHADYNAAEYMLETDWLDWSTPLPAVSVCELHGHADQHSETSDTETERYSAFMSGLLNPHDGYCVGCDKQCATCPRDHFASHVDKMSKDCRSLFKQCIWNGEEFDCCQHFRMLSTRDGRCFSANSDQTDKSPLAERLNVGHHTKDTVMRLTLSVPVQVFVHDTKDVSFKLTPSWPNATYRSGQRTDVVYTYHEHAIGESAHQLTAGQRKCVLPDERLMRFYPRYSHSACRSECRMRRQRSICNCTHHLLPQPVFGKRCDLEGLKCLDEHFKRNLGETKQKLERRKLKCKCRPECDVMEVKIVRYEVVGTQDGTITAVIALATPPNHRLVLHARASQLDIIVGIACISRLFTSASFLTVFEYLFYVYRRLRYRSRLETLPPEEDKRAAQVTMSASELY